MVPDSTEVSALLADYKRSSREALERMLPIVYQKLRYFAGLTSEEIADVLDLVPMKVRRAWLRREMAGSEHRDA